jgi:hypothetical protein
MLSKTHATVEKYRRAANSTTGPEVQLCEIAEPDAIIRAYLEGMPWKLKVTGEPALLLEHAAGNVWKVTTETGDFYVILGYGPPAHFSVNWMNNPEESGSPAEMVLRNYRGMSVLIQKEITAKRRAGTLGDE